MATPLGATPRREASAAGPDALRARHASVRAASLSIAEPLSEADCTVQSMPDASPAKWHLAHTTWFFETFVLERFDARHRPFDPRYRELFNSYYNSVGGQYPRPRRGLISRPGLDEVLRYRSVIDRAVERLIGSLRGDRARRLAEVVELGLQHEQQHQELMLTDCKHMLAQNPLHPAYRRRAPEAPAASAALRWHAFEGGIHQIGAHAGAAGFAFDNETPRHRVLLEPFELASRPVTNGEWRAFVRDGGYTRPELWLSDGWAFIREQQIEAPLYWLRDGDAWQQFTLAGREPLRDEDPVCHVSYYEAEAFASWAGARLPTEAEWECVAAEQPVVGRFVEDGRLQPAFGAAPRGEAGPRDLFGNVWEWTASPYVGYPRYRPPAGAFGEYNGKFMCDQWVLRGGSCATPRAHVRATYRNFFPAAARWQFSGLRLARDRD